MLFIVQLDYDPATLDYRAELQQLAASHPDIVLAVTYPEDGSILFKQASHIEGLDEIAWLGCDGNFGEGIFEDPECAAFMEKTIVAGTITSGPNPEEYAPYKELLDAYEAKTGTSGAQAPYIDTTYDAVMLVAKAIEKAGVYDGKAIREALIELGQNYEGTSGIVSFNDIGDRMSGFMKVWKVEKDPNATYGYTNVAVKIVPVG